MAEQTAEQRVRAKLAALQGESGLSGEERVRLSMQRLQAQRSAGLQPAGSQPEPSIPQDENVFQRAFRLFQQQFPITNPEGAEERLRRAREDPVFAAGASLISGIIPFFSKLPGQQEQLRVAQESFPKTFLAGQVAGTIVPGAASLKLAVKGVKAVGLTKFITQKIVPKIAKSARAQAILGGAGVAVTEGVIADALFEGLRGELPKAKNIAIFGAIDAVLPGPSINGIFRKLRTGKKVTAEEVKRIAELSPEAAKGLREAGSVVPAPTIKPRAEPLPPKQQKRAIGETKLERFSPEAQKTLRGAIEVGEKEIRTARGPTTIAAIKEGARQEGDIVRRAIAGKIPESASMNPEQAQALASATQTLAEDIAKNPTKLINDPAANRGALNLIKATFQAGSVAGRTLRQQQEIISDPRFFESLNIVKKNAGSDELIKVLGDLVSKNKTPPPRMMEKIAELARNMKLIASSSVERSLVGNTTMLMFKYADQGVSSAINRAISSLTRGRLKQDRFAQEVIADFVGAKSGVGDGFRSAWKILRDQTDEVSDLFFQREQFGKFISGRKGKVIRIGQNLQGAIDAMFRLPALRGEMSRRAVRLTLQEGEQGAKAFASQKKNLAVIQKIMDRKVGTLVGDELAIANKLKGKKSFDDFRDDITETSAALTFQKKLESKVARDFSAARRIDPTGTFGSRIGGLALNLIVPFFNTAANLWKEFAVRTPLLNLMRPNFWSNLRHIKTQGGLGRFSDDVAKMVNGGLFYAATTYIVTEALDGRITGRGPKNTRERNEQRNIGWKPYSVEIGNEYFPYRGFEPISSVMATIADFADGKEDRGLIGGFEKSMQNIFRSFAENPFFSGLSDVVDVLDGERKTLTQFAAALVKGAILPTVVKQTMNVMDPSIQRRPDSVEEELRRVFELPVIFKKLDPKFTPVGTAVTRKRPLLNLFPLSGLILGGGIQKSKDPVLNHLVEIKANLGPASSYKKINLTEKEKNRLNEIAGKQLYRAIAGLLTNEWYIELVKRDPDAARAFLLRRKSNIFNEQKRVIFGFRGEQLQGAPK